MEQFLFFVKTYIGSTGIIGFSLGFPLLDCKLHEGRDLVWLVHLSMYLEPLE